MNIGEMPRGWRLVPLSELLLPVVSSDPQDVYEQDVSYIDLSSVSAETKSVGKAHSMAAQDLPSRARRIVVIGDVLFSNVRPYRRAVAVVPELRNPVASTGFCVLRPATGVASRFLYYLVQSDQFNAGVLPLQRGVSYPAVSDNDVKAQLVGVPPAQEQIRIVDKLDALLSDLDEGIMLTNAALEKSHQLRSHLIDTAYSQLLDGLPLDPEERRPTDAWPQLSLSSLMLSASYGTSVKTDEEVSGTLVLRIPNVEQGRIHLESLKYATQPLDLKEEDYLHSGDILVVRTNGSVKLVGRAALVEDTLPPRSYFASYLIRIRLDKIRVHGGWVERFFATSFARDAIERGAASTSGQHNINLRVLRELQVPVPSLDVQRRVLLRLDQLTAQILSEEASMQLALEHAKTERARLIEAAIAGELVPQVATEEQVEILLKRARREHELALIAAVERKRARNVVKKEKAVVATPDAAYESIEALLTVDDWRDAQGLYREWRASRSHSTSLVAEFYSELGALVSRGILLVRADRDGDGRKRGDQVRRAEIGADKK